MIYYSRMSTSYIHCAIGSINHALSSRNRDAVIRNTRLSLSLVKSLYSNGLISHYYKAIPTGFENGNITNRNNPFSDNIRIFFRYGYDNQCSISYLKVRSRPGHRVFVSARDVHKLLDAKKKKYFLSTSKGIFSAAEAISHNCGGELLFAIYV